jgi:hypothetical protein
MSILDWIITLFVVLATVLLLLGFVVVMASLFGFEFRVGLSELSKLKEPFRLKGREVDPSSYWGRYVIEHQKPADTATGIALPKLTRAPEPSGAWEKDWTGGPPIP